MTQEPLVSVIVPNYNYARTLPLCLAALAAQTYAKTEVIVVDDRSTDDSVAVAASFDVTVVSPETNGGVSRARNLGAAHAAGEILFFVDSDVALAPDAVATAVDVFAADPGVAALCGNYDPEPLIRDSRVEEYRNFQQSWALAGVAGRMRHFIHPAIFAIRADVFAAVGPWNPRLRRTEGADYGQRLCAGHDVRLVPEVRGRHDNDDTLRTVLHKVYARSRIQYALFRRERQVGQVAATSGARASLATALAVATLPAPLLVGPVGLVLPGGLVAAAIRYDAPFYRAAVRYRGPVFGAYCVGVHLLVNLAIVTGVAAGAVQWATSTGYRRIHDPAAAADGRDAR